jgi:hypothetical protein
MTKLLVLITAVAALGSVAVLALSPSAGKLGDQQAADLASETPRIDGCVPVLDAGALEAEPTGPFRRAVVKANFLREAEGKENATAGSDRSTSAAVATCGGVLGEKTKTSSADDNELAAARSLEDRMAQIQQDFQAALPAPPATIPTSELPNRVCSTDAKGVVLPSILSEEPVSSSRSQPATGITRDTESGAAPRSLAMTTTHDGDSRVPVPSEPGKLSDRKTVPAIPSARVAQRLIPPAETVPAPEASPNRGPYPQCRYLGCTRPLADRDCLVCEEIQHYDYFPAIHGYYYFAPYNAIKVPCQQAFGTRFGGDPRVPYANGVFQTVYAEYWATHPVPAGRLPAATLPEEVPSPEASNPFEDPE